MNRSDRQKLNPLWFGCQTRSLAHFITNFKNSRFFALDTQKLTVINGEAVETLSDVIGVGRNNLRTQLGE